jgi:hypothetical protein
VDPEAGFREPGAYGKNLRGIYWDIIFNYGSLVDDIPIWGLSYSMK